MYDGDKIVLMGLPGSGKSTLGKHLSLCLHHPFYDLDELIIEETGCSISQYFKEKGEDNFRLLESSVLDKVLKEEKAIILSTGGGTPCYHDNIELINKNSISIYVDVPLHILVKRLMNNGGGERPMFYRLSEEEVSEKIISLKEVREKYYNKAKIKLSGSNISTELIISELKRFRS